MLLWFGSGISVPEHPDMEVMEAEEAKEVKKVEVLLGAMLLGVIAQTEADADADVSPPALFKSSYALLTHGCSLVPGLVLLPYLRSQVLNSTYGPSIKTKIHCIRIHRKGTFFRIFKVLVNKHREET